MPVCVESMLLSQTTPLSKQLPVVVGAENVVWIVVRVDSARENAVWTMT
jgi:hypothetical protein